MGVDSEGKGAVTWATDLAPLMRRSEKEVIRKRAGSTSFGPVQREVIIMVQNVNSAKQNTTHTSKDCVSGVCTVGKAFAFVAAACIASNVLKKSLSSASYG